MAPNTDKAVEVFFSYSHRDEELRDVLEKHLSILERQRVITGWHDRRIGAGREWKGEIDEHLNTARVILLLISADFLASDYCYDVEMKRAMERHETGEARVIPVILRDVDWKGAPFGKLQALPKDAKPVISWPNQDEAFTDVARGIRKAVEELTASPSGGATATVAPPGGPGLPPVWNVPHHRNPNFTGREELLAGLCATLGSGEPAAVTQAMTGLGGVGKTQLALEYAYRQMADYKLVWWVRAEESAKLAADYAALAGPLGLGETEEADQRVIIEAVRRRLDETRGWLLVFDNVREPGEVREYLPQAQTGHVIITSRNQNWGGTASGLSVPMMERAKSVEFLLKRTGQEDKAAAGEVAEALGDLPLALEQAGAYCEEAGKPLGEYLKLFREQRAKVLKQGGPPKEEYAHTVVTTWEMASKEVKEACPAAVDLLKLCAFLAPDDIPRELLTEGAKHLPKRLAACVQDAMAFDEAVAALRRYSLVEVTGDAAGPSGLSIHRLVQAVTRDRLTKRARHEWAGAAVRLVNGAFPTDSDDVRTWPVCSRLLAHALAAAVHAEEVDGGAEVRGRLLNQAGIYLHGRAQFPQARATLEQALATQEAAYGPNHPNLVTGVNNLGSVLRAMGDADGARAQYERALAMGEAAYGVNHPWVAGIVSNLGGVHMDVGYQRGERAEFEAARAQYERALAIMEAAHGRNSPRVATSANNLGTSLRVLGDLEGARAHFERALAMDEAAYGRSHPQVASDLNNIGSVLWDLGDLEGARSHAQRALAMDEAAYGPDHPAVGIQVTNLGDVLEARGKLEEARVCFDRALAIFTSFLGENHPHTMLARHKRESLGRKRAGRKRRTGRRKR